MLYIVFETNSCAQQVNPVVHQAYARFVVAGNEMVDTLAIDGPLIKNQIVRRLLAAELTVTDRRYLGHEDETGYHQYAIDVAKEYELED